MYIAEQTLEPRIAAIDAALVATFVITGSPVLLIGIRTNSPFLVAGFIGGLALILAHIMTLVDRRALQVAALAPIFLIASGQTLFIASVFEVGHRTFDAELARLDGGIAPAIWHWATARSWAIDPLTIGYDALPLVMMLAMATAGEKSGRLIKAATLGGLLVVPWYFILPAVGPAHVGELLAPRNCMPSMHMTWALLIFTAQPTGWRKQAAGIFVAITALATLATGEHYTPDLVAALPWAWALNRIAERRAA